MIRVFDHAARVARARTEMAASGIGAMLLSVGSDLPYLFGYQAMANERLTMAVLPAEGVATLVVPRLEVPRVHELPDVFRIASWAETESPIALVDELLDGVENIAIGDQTWSRFVLALQAETTDRTWVSAAPIMDALRLIKEPAELDLLRAAGAAVDRVAVRLANHRFSGKSERSLAGEVAAMTVEEGSDVATFTIVAAGPNGASPHHEPTDRIIEVGDTVVLDFGGKIGGYCSDTTRTFVVGAPTGQQQEVHSVVEAAQRAGRDAARPGAVCSDVDRAARAVIADAGYGADFLHRLGHGIGLDGHEAPYLVDANQQVLEEGMAFSIEPGIYLADRFGVRIEDIAACTATGIDVFNDSPRTLVSVE